MSSAAYDALMLDYAAGAASEAERLVVETHVGLAAAGREFLRTLDAVGGALFEGAPARDLAKSPPALPVAPRPAPPSRAVRKADAARALVQAARLGGQGLHWRWRPGLQECWLPVEGASLLRIASGAAMPRHGHQGEEITLVLRGAFADEQGLYRAGEICFADAEVEHTPRVVGREDCVCLVAATGRALFRCPVTRLASWILK